MHFLYHDIDFKSAARPSGFQSASARKYKLSEEVLNAHVSKLNKFVVNQQNNGDCSTTNSINFSFDDGGASAMYASELLETFGFSGIFFVVTNLIGKAGFLNVRDIRELSNRGHIIGSHSQTHPDRMAFLPLQMLKTEWESSKNILEDILGKRINTCSIPGGSYRLGTLQMTAATGYSKVYTSEPTLNCVGRTIDFKTHKIQVLGRIPVSKAWSPAYLNEFLESPKAYIKALRFRYFLKRILVDTNPTVSKLYNTIRRNSDALY